MEYLTNDHSPKTSVAVISQRTAGGGDPNQTSAAYLYDGEIREDSRPDSVTRYWLLFRRHKAAILAYALGAAFLAFLSGLIMPTFYSAQASVEVLTVNDNFLDTKQSSPVTTADNFEISEVETQASLMVSPVLIENVLKKLDPELANLAPPALPASTGWQLLRQDPGSPVTISPRAVLLLKAADSLKVKAIQKTRIVQITVHSRDPQIASTFANALVQEFIDENIAARFKSAEQTNKWLARELDDARTKLKAADDALQSYTGSSGLVYTDNDDTNISTEKLQQIQGELSATTADRISKQSRYELAQSSPPESLPDVLNDQTLRSTWLKLVDLRRTVADLSTVYAPDYIKLSRAQAELTSVQASFDLNRAQILERIRNDYSEAQRKESLLVAEYQRQMKEVSNEGEKSVQYNILKRDVDSSQHLYDTMLQQLKQSSIASVMNAGNIRLAEAAEPSASPWWPNFKILSAAGFILGVFSSFAGFLIGENADRTIQRPGDVMQWTNLPELGIIPRQPVARSRRPQGVLTGDRTPRALIDSRPSFSNLSISPIIKEAFRSALTSILFFREDHGRSKVFVVTSANSAEGKTTCACNLAREMAEVKKRILLIDADLRRPRIHNAFGVGNENGLADILRSDILASDTLENAIQSTGIPGLDVMTAGSDSHSNANLLYSENLQQMLNKMRKNYDMIVFDTPPMLQINDARVVARLADSVILVVRSQKTTRDAVIAAHRKFLEDGTQILGTLLNDWDPKHSLENYSYRYEAYSYTRDGHYFKQ